MFNLLRQLWQDDAGYLLSTEAAAVGTVGVLGATAGIGAVSQSMNDELTETAFAIRSLDQSFSIPEQRGTGSWTAGSSFVQPNVEESHAALNRFLQERGQKTIEPDAANRELTRVPTPIEAQPLTLNRQVPASVSPEEREEWRRIRQRQRQADQDKNQLQKEQDGVPQPIDLE